MCHKLLYNVNFYWHYFLVCINLIEKKHLHMLPEDENKKQK